MKTFFALLVTISLAGGNAARADEALPSQDQALARALENHPDIVAAKAKVALADAELYGKRMEVSRQVLGLYGNLKRMSSKISASEGVLQQAKTELEAAKQRAEAGQATESDVLSLAGNVQAAEAQLVQIIGQREQMAEELRLLVSTASPAAEAKSSSVKRATAARQMPQGPIIDKAQSAGEKTIELDFVDQPLVEVMAFLSQKAGVVFSIQQPVFDSIGLPVDTPITLHTGAVRLRDALQAIEDRIEGVQFVLRDYGVLLTTREYAETHGYMPVLELGKESNGIQKPVFAH